VSEREDYEDPGLGALVRAYVGCRVVVDALPELPVDVRREVEPHLADVMGAIGPALLEADPGFFDRDRR
jgi:hypothetical protein